MIVAPPQPSDPLDRARRHIETHLDGDLSLARLAGAAGLSPYHFSRQFTARHGFSPTAYVRARRLEGAAQRLRAGPPISLIDLALECGFDSQEGFTRAFTRTFGVPPGRYRDGERPARVDTPALAQLPATHLIQAPTPARKPALRIAGLADDFDQERAAEIPRLWDRLTPRLPLAGQSGGGTFGVCCASHYADTLHYVAGVALRPDAPAPGGLEVIDLAAGTYLIFRQVLTGGPLHPQMEAAVREIWADRVPRSGFSLVRAPDLEVYPEHFDPTRPGAWVEWWIPVDD